MSLPEKIETVKPINRHDYGASSRCPCHHMYNKKLGGRLPASNPERPSEKEIYGPPSYPRKG